MGRMQEEMEGELMYNMSDSIVKLAEAARILNEVRTELIVANKMDAAHFVTSVCETIANVADDLETGAL